MAKKKSDTDALLEAVLEGRWSAQFAIEELGAKAVPALVRAMDDPRALQGTQLRPEPAIIRIWAMLAPFYESPSLVKRSVACFRKFLTAVGPILLSERRPVA